MGGLRRLTHRSYTQCPAGVLNFGGLVETNDQARFSVLPVPYDLTTTYISGTRNGPLAIIEASTQMELYDVELGKEPYLAGIETLRLIEPTVAGPREMIEKVNACSKDILKRKKIPVMLGGEHSLTLGLVEALKGFYPRLSVLQLDAHADMRDRYQDSPFSHASVARRIHEICPMVQVGIRSLSREEAGFLKRGKKKNPVRTFYAHEMAGAGMPIDEVLDGLTDQVFITIDLDVFDPSIMPGTGTPEPGGLLWHEVTRFLRKVAAEKRVKGFDIMELCPIPGNVSSDFTAARLTYKIMGYINESLDGQGLAPRQ
ncbi:MAG: agmatinase [Deltaproteobacteria bacterium]|nr:agmatinase [Deltaproteobacteria bacterium]